MALISSREMVLQAQAGGYAVGAFNAENMEMVQAILAAAEEARAPVIIQTTSGTLKYAPPSCFAGLTKGLAQQVSVPVALHLDHGSSYALAEQCAQAGYTSLMIDGSLLAFDENVKLTASVVEMARTTPVEAELGTVGGKEDGHEASAQYTVPSQAVEFVERTGIFSLAVAIGTAHGVYKGTPRLDLDRLTEIRQAVSIPLVLHGTSGVPDAQVRECIQRGICKVNYATELRIAFTNAVKEVLCAQQDAYDPKQYLAAGRAAVQQRVVELIRVCGSYAKA